MISKETIDKVFELARVEEVIADFVVLKKSGANYKGLSPFTNEKTPSFVVSPAKQIWKDFSSGKGGNVIAFLMEHEHFNYPESIKYIAEKYNIEIEETKQLVGQDLDKHIKMLENQMLDYASKLEFEKAIRIRDEINRLKAKQMGLTKKALEYKK